MLSTDALAYYKTRGVKHFYGLLKPRDSGRPKSDRGTRIHRLMKFGRCYLREPFPPAPPPRLRADSYYIFIVICHRNFIERKSQVCMYSVLAILRCASRNELFFFFSLHTSLILSNGCFRSSLSPSRDNSVTC